MATAMKCDRCGKLYEKYSGTNGVAPIERVEPNQHDPSPIMYKTAYDLCPSCMSYFEKFIEKKEGLN